MARDFSIVRRRANFVSFTMPYQANLTGYQIDTAPNFDGTYTTRFTATPGVGFVDPLLSPSIVYAQPSINISSNNRVYCMFDPASFSIDDTKQFWMRLVPVTSGGPGTPGAGHQINPYRTSAHPISLVVGTAPQGATIANSQELQLSSVLTNLTITNLDATAGRNLMIALDATGPEITIPPSGTYQNYQGTASVIYVRAVGGTAAFQLSGTYPY